MRGTKNILLFPDQISNFRQIEISPILVDFNFCVPQISKKQSAILLPVPIFAPSLSMCKYFHMHLIGTISTEAVLLNDTIPLIKIPEWDFEWQVVWFPKTLKYLLEQKL